MQELQASENLNSIAVGYDRELLQIRCEGLEAVNGISSRRLEMKVVRISRMRRRKKSGLQKQLICFIHKGKNGQVLGTSSSDTRRQLQLQTGSWGLKKATKAV